MAILDCASAVELHVAHAVAVPWDASLLTRELLTLHLELRRGAAPAAELLWGDLRVLRGHGDLTQRLMGSPKELVLVPVGEKAVSASLATLPTLLGCPLPAHGMQVAFPEEMSAAWSSI